MSITSNIGMLLLAIFLILFGINSLGFGFTIPPTLTGIIALLSGILILIKK